MEEINAKCGDSRVIPLEHILPPSTFDLDGEEIPYDSVEVLFLSSNEEMAKDNEVNLHANSESNYIVIPGDDLNNNKVTALPAEVFR